MALYVAETNQQQLKYLVEVIQGYCLWYPPIYINNWIADWLFTKQPSSEAKE